MQSSAIAAVTDSRLLKRSCETLIGIACGLIADGELNDKEIIFLSTWLSENSALCDSWPGEVVYRRVREVLSDGVITADEQDDLLSTLKGLVGGSFQDEGCVPAGATTLPLDEEAVVRIAGCSFCFTGKFLFGTRSACERAVEAAGGRLSAVNRSLDYLVIGEMASREWKHSSHGLKIQSAMDLRTKGGDVRVVSERQWIAALPT